MSVPTAVTLVRTRPWQYQTTYWDDGTARWDGITGTRLGAWQASTDPEWFRRLCSLATGLGASTAATTGDLTVIVETDTDTTITITAASEGDEPDLVWVVAMLLDGMTTRTVWAPLDTAGLTDLTPWADGRAVFLHHQGRRANGLALPQGIVVLAGSQLSATTSPSLGPIYSNQRSKLQDDGSLTLENEHFVLTRHLHFHTPSAAASVVVGSNTNGRQAWQDNTGSPWSDLEWAR